ncbi:MAG TPA: cytochrome c oxidase assembly protein, partial [Miltoncostaeaceae bacterium]|nr:cytochrome c oxidase assembly protein [Miltoncostaeaceae bacterium]
GPRGGRRRPRAARRAPEPGMRWRAIAFVAAIAVVEAAVLMPVGSIEGHIIAHALVLVVAAPLLVLAAPLGVLLRPLPPTRRRRVVAALRGGPLGWPAAPLLAWLAFVAGHWAVLVVVGTQHHLTGLADLGLHGGLLVVGVLFWLPVLGHGQVVRRLRGPSASLYLFLAMPAADLTVVWLMARGETAAAGVMLTAMLPLGIAAIAVSWSWIAGEERAARAGEAAR